MEDNNTTADTDENVAELQITGKVLDLRYGWGKFRPKCLQVFNSPKWFMCFLTIFSTTQGMTVMGITNLVLPTIEKRFHLSAKELGFIAASNDISAILIVCFVSFYGGYGNKIKWLGYGALITGIGALFFMLPHVLVGTYNPAVSAKDLPQRHQSDLCTARNLTQGSPFCVAVYDSRWYYLALFSFAQMLMGAGTTPLWSLGPAYIDENVHPKSSPIYLGVWFAATILGPGMGFLVGAPILSVYVDLKQPSGIKLTPRDPQWIGAWWLGYFAAGIFLIFSSVFVLGFPIEMPGARAMREKAMKDGDIPRQDDKIKGNVKDFLPATLQLLRNPTFMFNTAGTTMGSLFGGGISAFLAKILQLKFDLNPVLSGIALGSILIPGAAGGVLLGGFIVRRFKLKNSCKMSAKFCVIFQCISFWGGLCWLIPGCDELLLAGVSAPYFNSTVTSVSLGSDCNLDCACPNNQFNPVCGTDQLTYFSPCHAGCTSKANFATYSNCSCVPLTGNVTGSATKGYCYRGPGCKNFIPFLFTIMVLLLAVFLSTVPNKTVVLRSVPYNQRAFALGFQFIFLRALGFLPGPIIFGALVDSFCLLWSNNCGEKGNCLVYNITQLSYRITAIGLLFSGTALLMFFLSYRCYKPEMDEEEAQNKQENDVNQNLLMEKETVM